MQECRCESELTDSEWGFEIGGFGGTLDDDAVWDVEADPDAPDRPNVVMVHGNVVDAADWYPVRDAFIGAGWSPDDLWAFIDAVRAFTGEDDYVLIGHSLGVTLARKTLADHPDLRSGLLAFVSLAGANHGTSLCPPGSEGVIMSCDEIAEGTDWLAELNGPDGTLETYGPTRWLSVYDGTGAMDVAFLATYAESPVLAGAENVALADNHNDLRIDPASIDLYREASRRQTADGRRCAMVGRPPTRRDPDAPPAAFHRHRGRPSRPLDRRGRCTRATGSRGRHPGRGCPHQPV